MRKLLVFIGVLLALHVALLFVRPGGAQAPAARGGRPLTVGVVFDVGGRGDKSFNDAAYLGVSRAEEELDVEASYLEPASTEDREAALRLFAARGFDL